MKVRKHYSEDLASLRNPLMAVNGGFLSERAEKLVLNQICEQKLVTGYVAIFKLCLRQLSFI